MKKIAWSLFVLTLVIPPALHFVVNLYWWLFDGNTLDGEKMSASGFMTFITTMIAGAWVVEGRVWNRSKERL